LAWKPLLRWHIDEKSLAVRGHVVDIAGGSKYPIDLLKDGSVDMTADEPLDLTIKAMNRVMDEIDAILARRK
jgi:Ethanolamine utilization protein EutJ (predicted chaperonin)